MSDTNNPNSTSTVAAPSFHNITVVVVPTPDGSGNAGGGKWKVTCSPYSCPVFTGDAILNYQLVAPTPSGIVFAGYEACAPLPGRELSRPSISVDGKMMTFSDRNSKGETILVTLRFKDIMEILYDPEIPNDGIR
ncbi:hypothetical protein NX773_07125 [Massilia solisilvae]|uniref:MD-2-related lipid-recognition domain-containing protein n=1 Tax=Massilia solisilvae TaxID=1811225 RepID=A0ABT2BHE3_9BURK|nr:hypothetical protein [Massilia solisilvae]MCS0607932.1 hypothetical protein [Massilia solisilvae]